MEVEPRGTKNSLWQEIQLADGAKEIVLDIRFENYITYVAAGGLQVLEDGSLKPISLNNFLDEQGLNKSTLWRNRQSLPDFGERVKKRRQMLYSEDRVSQVWKGVFLRAARGDAEQAKMILSHYGDYQPPAQRVESNVTVNGFTDLITAAKGLGIIEGEIVDGSVQYLPD